MAKTPTTQTVVRILKGAGFQHARYAEGRTPRSSGFYVRRTDQGVCVTYQEGDADFEYRMRRGGYTAVEDVPEDPEAARLVAQYAPVLRQHFAVEVFGGDTLYVTPQ